MNLSVEETTLFYRLFWGLMAYANRHLKVIPKVSVPQDFATADPNDVGKLRNALWEHPNLLERFVAENPEGLSDEELAIVSSWRHRVASDFYILRFLKKYAVFMNGREPLHLYGVLGLYDSLEEVVRGRPVPIMVRAVLLPFRDKIIYDSLLNVYSIYFGGGIRSSLKEDYNRLKEREGIIEGLVGPTGEPQVRTSLDRRASRKPAPDWRAVVDEIVAQTQKMRQADTRLQGAAFGLLRATANLVQATLQQPEALDEHRHHLRQVRRALTRLENLLVEEEYW